MSSPPLLFPQPLPGMSSSDIRSHSILLKIRNLCNHPRPFLGAHHSILCLAHRSCSKNGSYHHHQSSHISLDSRPLRTCVWECAKEARCRAENTGISSWGMWVLSPWSSLSLRSFQWNKDVKSDASAHLCDKMIWNLVLNLIPVSQTSIGHLVLWVVLSIINQRKPLEFHLIIEMGNEKGRQHRNTLTTPFAVCL